ncbi:hypothetical protein F8144_01110 [Streptomyces triticiradicis]|uniref:Uncharacterized protein n=1 Tax=Streptomyces triticiradicis TaxID=2651189 RepID=A0A7J5DP60_9ACTN|nr:hypothetical protein F8144_01110 [Streptomyces triticiradicis]
MDVSKAAHHGHGLTPAGNRVFDKQLPTVSRSCGPSSTRWLQSAPLELGCPFGCTGAVHGMDRTVTRPSGGALPLRSRAAPCPGARYRSGGSCW